MGFFNWILCNDFGTGVVVNQYSKCAAFRYGSFSGSSEIYPLARGNPQNMAGSLRAGSVFSLLHGAGIRRLILHPTKAKVCRAMNMRWFPYIAKKIRLKVTFGTCVKGTFNLMDWGLSCSGEMYTSQYRSIKCHCQIEMRP